MSIPQKITAEEFISNNSKKKRNKYNASKTEYNGIIYDSKLEASYALGYDKKKQAKIVLDWSRQHCFELLINSTKICKYRIDFRVVNTDGWIDYVEVKGMPTALWKLKWKITKALFTDLTKGENARLILNNEVVMVSETKKTYKPIGLF